MFAKRRTTRFVFIIAFILCTQLLNGFSFHPKNKSEPEQEKRGLFSWSKEAIADGGKDLTAFMKQHGYTELYQWFSNDIKAADIASFLNNTETEGIVVYMLTGDPEWARDRRAESMLMKVAQASEINKSTKGRGLKGIVFDVEPYLLSNWKTSSDRIMDTFVSGMKKAYQAASVEDLETVICIPYYYDTEGFDDELETLIRAACDRVAVMNYYKGKEAKLIENEADYAKTYGKGLINIYEFLPPGEHSLKEINTYYHDGVEAAYENFAELKKTYPDVGLMMAANYYEALKEVLERK